VSTRCRHQIIALAAHHTSIATQCPSSSSHSGAADLFLDNLWVNAHTTATETLWAGVPVLTVPNVPLASRVASSLLQAAGLPELIARNQADYLHMARVLSARPQVIRSLQNKLRESRSTLPLFHSSAYANELERVIMLFAEAQAAVGGDAGRGSALHVAVTDSEIREKVGL
jgi:protein O-GlcNAc transferase